MTTELLGDLRTLAHGVYPALLTGAGLGPALEGLGPSVVVTHLPQQRFAPGIERTAYLLVSELAARGPVRVAAAVIGEELVMKVDGGRLVPALAGERARAALGGSLSVTEQPDRGEDPVRVAVLEDQVLTRAGIVRRSRTQGWRWSPPSPRCRR